VETVVRFDAWSVVKFTLVIRGQSDSKDLPKREIE